MSTQKFIHYPVDISQAFSKISKIQTDALVKIARGEISGIGALEMKHLAETALIESHRTAEELLGEIQKN